MALGRAHTSDYLHQATVEFAASRMQKHAVDLHMELTGQLADIPTHGLVNSRKLLQAIFIFLSSLSLAPSSSQAYKTEEQKCTLEHEDLEHGDLIEVFKIFKGLDDVKPTDFFTMPSTGLRGHEFKLYKPQAHLDIRKIFLASE